MVVVNGSGGWGVSFFLRLFVCLFVSFFLSFTVIGMFSVRWVVFDSMSHVYNITMRFHMY